MNTDLIKFNFTNGFVGEFISPTGTVKIGQQPDGVAPYHLLYGALGSCFYATFLGVVKKMQLTFDRAEMSIVGNKRSTVPTILDLVQMELTVFGASDQKKMEKAAELGAKYCSIHETIAQVAPIEFVVKFQ